MTTLTPKNHQAMISLKLLEELRAVKERYYSS